MNKIEKIMEIANKYNLRVVEDCAQSHGNHWNGKTVEVKKYLHVDSVYDIIMITLQKSYEDGIYNPVKLDVYFHLNLVYLYTNLVFTEEEREDEFKLYDELYSSGFIKKFLEFVDSKQYSEMQDDISEIIDNRMKYSNSAASVMRKFVDDLPENAADAAKIVENFDPQKYHWKDNLHWLDALTS